MISYVLKIFLLFTAVVQVISLLSYSIIDIFKLSSSTIWKQFEITEWSLDPWSQIWFINCPSYFYSTTNISRNGSTTTKHIFRLLRSTSDILDDVCHMMMSFVKVSSSSNVINWLFTFILLWTFLVWNCCCRYISCFPMSMFL